MALPTTFSNILIEGNTIDAGFSGSPTTEYTYSGLILTDSDCRIFNNYFSGIQNNTSNTFMILSGNAACNIQSNTFVRGNSSITNYIKSAGTIDQIITGNIFDGYTVDGTSFANVSGITANTNYSANKNQVGYAIVPLGAEKTAIFNTNGGLYNIFNFSDASPPTTSNDLIVTAGYAIDPYVLRICDSSVSPDDQVFWTSIDITKSLPIGAKIIDAKISIYNPSTIHLDTSSLNQFQLFLSSSRGHAQAIDIKTFTSSSFPTNMINFSSVATLVINAGNEANLRSNYQVMEIPTLNFTGTVEMAGSGSTVSNQDISSNYVTGGDSNLNATLFFSFKSNSGGSPNTPILLVSPLIITYVW